MITHDDLQAVATLCDFDFNPTQRLFSHRLSRQPQPFLRIVRPGARSQEDQVPWNPISNDGDSRRLEVALAMDVCIYPPGEYVTAWAEGASQGQAVDYATCAGDVAAATRLAVFAAALQLAKDQA